MQVYERVCIGESLSKQQIFDIAVRHAFMQKGPCLDRNGWPVLENELGHKSWVGCFLPPCNWERCHDISYVFKYEGRVIFHDKETHPLLRDLEQFHNLCSQKWIDDSVIYNHLPQQEYIKYHEYPLMFMGLALAHDLSPIAIWFYGKSFSHPFLYDGSGQPLGVDEKRLIKLIEEDKVDELSYPRMYNK